MSKIYRVLSRNGIAMVKIIHNRLNLQIHKKVVKIQDATLPD